jgi:O-antigen/teichoic acid export membrane protein
MANASAIGRIEAARSSVTSRCRAFLRSALVEDSLSYFGSKVVPGFMGLISVPVFIRLIGLDQYGRFAVAVPILMAVAGASSGWLAQGILRFHPAGNDAQASEVVFDRAVTGAAIITIFVTSVALAIVLAGRHESLLTSLASLAFCISLLLYTITLAKFQAQLQPTLVLRREIVRSTGGFLIPVALVAITGRRQFEFVLLGQALAYTIAFLPSSRAWGHSRPTANSYPENLRSDNFSSGQTLRQLWRFGWAVGLWLLLSQSLPIIDRWTIQKFASYTSAGIYASLYEVTIRSLSFLVFPLTQAAHPRIMRAWNEGRFAESHQIIRFSVVAQLIIFVTILGGVLFGAHRITKLVLGFDDPVAGQVLPVLLVGGFLWQLALLVHKPLEIQQRTGAMLVAMAAVVVVNIAACFHFIPRFGFQAASYILVLSAFLYIALTLCMSRFGAFRRFRPVTEP